MAVIKTKSGVEISVDDEDFESLIKFSWSIRRGYATRSKRVGRKVKTMCMHREIMGLCPLDDRTVDHIDGNKLNNRKENLRICSQAENARNRKLNSNNKIGLKGVDIERSTGKFRARIGIGKGKQLYLGTFETAQDAHAKYCEMERIYFGEFARDLLAATVTGQRRERKEKIKCFQ